MFDELIRQIGRLDGMQVSVPMEADEEGYFDRECPSKECAFKIHVDDWQEKVCDEEVFCPFCGHSADSDQWWTQEQLSHAEKAALNQVQDRLGCAMKRDSDRWNRRQPRDSLIRITMDVKDRPRSLMVPSAVAGPMQLKITCPECNCRYAVVGAAFFCPACAHNAAGQVFHQTIAGIRATLDALPALYDAIADRDAAETMGRLVIENSLQNAVTAFQHYAEALFSRHPSPPRVRRNAFQSLPEGSRLWQTAFGKSYDDHLGPDEIAALSRYVQQRHLLAHRQGLVDVEYVERSGDASYRPGQRLVIREGAVRHCLDLIATLGKGLDGDTEAERG